MVEGGGQSQSSDYISSNLTAHAPNSSRLQNSQTRSRATTGNDTTSPNKTDMGYSASRNYTEEERDVVHSLLPRGEERSFENTVIMRQKARN